MTNGPIKSALRSALGRLAGELFEVAYDASEAFVGVQIQKARDRRERSAEPFEPAELGYPAGARLSRSRCPRCDGPYFYVKRGPCEMSNGAPWVEYFCADPKCKGPNGLNELMFVAGAATREGVPL